MLAYVTGAILAAFAVALVHRLIGASVDFGGTSLTKDPPVTDDISASHRFGRATVIGLFCAFNSFTSFFPLILS